MCACVAVLGVVIHHTHSGISTSHTQGNLHLTHTGESLHHTHTVGSLHHTQWNLYLIHTVESLHHTQWNLYLIHTVESVHHTHSGICTFPVSPRWPCCLNWPYCLRSLKGHPHNAIRMDLSVPTTFLKSGQFLLHLRRPDYREVSLHLSPNNCKCLMCFHHL